MDNSQYRDMFVQEAREHIENLNKFLLHFEQEPEVQEHVNTLFRSAHSLKGMAATMGYDQIREVCMAIEGLFEKFRKSEERLSANLANSLFKCFDLLQELVDDENKKIDLEPYLQLLGNHTDVEIAENSELSSSSPHTKSQTIRVRMEDLDSLVNLVGELVIDKMRLERSLPNMSEETHQVITSLSRLISDLQYQTMKVRLVPVEQIFNRFPRMIRDLATSLGKEVKLEMEGLGIELDRTVLDAITEPLLHILRNSLDHGIEIPSERESVGKPRSALIKLVASRIGDRVAIKIEDDGKGIDIDRIKSKAIEKKFITESEARQMNDEEVLNLLGTPGLSSAKSITEVSGRGVGMDIVFKQVEGVGGQVQIQTKKGIGTSITLIIPLSLAIIGGLLVKVGNEKYVMPLSSITTTVSVERNEIKTIHGNEVMTLRDQVVPLIKVADALGIKSSIDKSQENQPITVVVVDKGGKTYGLIVDSYESMQEIVTKRMHSSDHSNFSDASILSDGKVVLILDPSVVI
ncbi:MAG: chemotaxis protein CheA [Thaumarchaeota archaeon]|nr:chemotaxis protein CheA [Nitrososphaerota archaeon]MBI3641141.1 chemotaxis protein CheA [Nitrososphaerota archaeon]